MKYSKASTTIEKKQRNVRQLIDQWTRRRRKKKRFSIKRAQCTNKRKKQIFEFSSKIFYILSISIGKNKALARKNNTFENLNKILLVHKRLHKTRCLICTTKREKENKQKKNTVLSHLNFRLFLHTPSSYINEKKKIQANTKNKKKCLHHVIFFFLIFMYIYI